MISKENSAESEFTDTDVLQRGSDSQDLESPLKIHYEDNHHLVVEKMPNLLSQGDITGRDDVLTLMKAYLVERENKPGEAWLAAMHRLDYPVGGLMLLAKTSKAASRLAAQMREHRIERLYLCVVEGKTLPEGTLEHWLLKDRDKNITRSVPANTPQAKYASLRYWLIATQEDKSLVLVKLGTGRSHQIRVQFREAGHPLLGDRRYGDNVKRVVYPKDKDGLALFACGLSWEHVTLKEARRVMAYPSTEHWLSWQSYESQVFQRMENLFEQGS